MAAMAWEEAAVAAIKNRPEIQSLLAAAMALPMVACIPGAAVAGSAPEQTTIGFKYLSYKDYERTVDRMKITVPQLWLDTALTTDLQLQASTLVDSISGASPIRANVLKPVNDTRHASDLKLTKYFEEFSIGLAASDSRESDYLSKSVSLDTRIDFNDRNTTLALGYSATRDDIDNPADATRFDRRKSTDDFLIGVTQLIDPQSLFQINLAWSRGNGYYSDPYKNFEQRPESRRQTALLMRYVGFVPRFDGALHADYRYFQSDWGVNADTIDVSWYQNLEGGWQVIPGARYYRQHQADFYFNDADYPTGRDLLRFFSTNPRYYSADQRLASFGGMTYSLKLAKNFADGWQSDIKYEQYRQSAGLYFGGTGTGNLNTFYAKAITFGVSKTF